MNLIATDLPDCCVIEVPAFDDHRGVFHTPFNKFLFEEHGICVNWTQDYHSVSHRDVLRGLHFQLPPFNQAKLVRVVRGAILDVAVDLRQGSPTYGRWTMQELSCANRRIMFVPHGFAHGFLALDECIVLYKADATYSRAHDAGILWNDPHLGIEWPVETPILSEKDRLWPSLAQFVSPFHFPSQQTQAQDTMATQEAMATPFNGDGSTARIDRHGERPR